MPIVAVVNQKGGVGKTTIALGLAAAASHRGARVLVVDLDAQANATSGLGVWEPATTIDVALEADRPGSVRDLAVPSGWPVPDTAADGAVPPDVIPSSPALAAREPVLANDPVGAQDRLQRALEGNGYDLVLVDCPPSLGLLTINGLFAADRALIVTEPGAWACDGVAEIQRTIGRIADRRDGRPAIAGIVVNRLGRTRDAKYWYGQLIEQYGDEVLSPVALRAAVAEASAQSLPIHALGSRAGAPKAAAELDDLLDAVVPELARPTAVAAPDPATPSDLMEPGKPGEPGLDPGEPGLDPAPVDPTVPDRAGAPSPDPGSFAGQPISESVPSTAPSSPPATTAPPSTGELDVAVRPTTFTPPPVAR